MMQLNATPHHAEADLRHLVGSAANDPGTIEEARRLGIPWLTILTLLVQYGPQAMAVLLAIIQALKTPAPAPLP